MDDRAAIRESFVQLVRDEYPNAGDGIISLFDAALAATPDGGWIEGKPLDRGSGVRVVLDKAADWILEVGLPSYMETWRPEYEALLAEIDAVLHADAG